MVGPVKQEKKSWSLDPADRMKAWPIGERVNSPKKMTQHGSLRFLESDTGQRPSRGRIEMDGLIGKFLLSKVHEMRISDRVCCSDPACRSDKGCYGGF
jgi:hypothetical protein